MTAFTMPLVELDAALYALYGKTDLDDAGRVHRANLANAYHDRTGRYFAARFYY